jgi:hypothetical protein
VVAFAIGETIMTLSDFANISTAISGLAVTGSLIYLALQTHQNSKHTRALVNQGRINRISEQAMAVTNPELAAAIIASLGGEPTQEEVRRLQFSYFARARFYNWQDSFAQHERGLLDEDIFKQMSKTVADTVRQTAWRDEWERTIRTPGTSFAAFVDGFIAQLPVRVPGTE